MDIVSAIMLANPAFRVLHSCRVVKVNSLIELVNASLNQAHMDI